MERINHILDIIKKNPGIRFNEIMRISSLKNGTLSHYVRKLEEKGHIMTERSPRVTRIYPQGISKEESVICRFLTTNTTKKLILFLLEKEVATYVEIRQHLKKSPSVISVTLKTLFKHEIINKEYDIPSNKFSLENPELVRAILNEYYPDTLQKLESNMVEMFGK